MGVMWEIKKAADAAFFIEGVVDYSASVTFPPSQVE